MNRGLLIMSLCALLCACNDEGVSTKPTEVPDENKEEGLFAVISNNYSGAVSISLLDHEGEVIKDEWAGSKTKDTKLRSPFSDDVVMPTTSESVHYLTAIERGLGVITRFDLDSGDVVGQVRTDDSSADDETAFHSNPQDVYYVSATSAWVSRWGHNAKENAPAAERGSDLIEFNPKTMKRTERRIDLSELAAEVEETQYDENFEPIGMMKNPAHARPAGLVPAGDFVVVGLVRATENYSYAPGMIAVVDPKTAKLTDSIDLEGVSNCGEVRPVLDADDEVLVVCVGSWGDGGAAAGIFRIAVDAKGQARVAQKFRIADHDKAVNTNSYAVSLGGDRVVIVAPGSLDEKMEVDVPDAVYVVDIKTGKQTKLEDSAGAYSLGIPAYDAETGVLLVPDAGDGADPIYGVQRFIVDKDGTVEHDAFVKVAPKTTLAAREIHLL